MYVIKQYAMKAYVGVESGGIVPPLSTLALLGGDWSVSHHCHCSFSAHWTGGCVGPRASLDNMEKRKITCLYQEMNPTHSAHCLFAILTEVNNLNNLFFNRELLDWLCLTYHSVSGRRVT
jgi:hypothetical protein